MKVNASFTLDVQEKSTIKKTLTILKGIRDLCTSDTQGDIYYHNCYELNEADLRSISDSLSILLQDELTIV